MCCQSQLRFGIAQITGYGRHESPLSVIVTDLLPIGKGPFAVYSFEKLRRLKILLYSSRTKVGYFENIRRNNDFIALSSHAT